MTNMKKWIWGISLLMLASCQCGKTGECNTCTGAGSYASTVNEDSAAVVRTIMARRSVRKYKPEAVRRDQMEVIVRCGLNAPSGMNQQPWAVRVVDNPEFLDGITALWLAAMEPARAAETREASGFRNMFRNAPTVVFIAAPVGGKGNLDCGLMGENMILAAQSMGIGSCCLGGPIAFMKSDVATDYIARLQLPDGYELLYAIGMGYPDEAPDAKPRDESKAMYVE